MKNQNTSTRRTVRAAEVVMLMLFMLTATLIASLVIKQFLLITWDQTPWRIDEILYQLTY